MESFLFHRLYRNVASELGFGEFHLYLRPLHFEFAHQKVRAQQRPVFITEILKDDGSVDRYNEISQIFRINLPLGIIAYSWSFASLL